MPRTPPPPSVPRTSPLLLPSALLAALAAATPGAGQVAWTPFPDRMAPSPNDGMVHDPAAQKLVVFDQTDLGDAWEWSGTAWSRRASAHQPPPSWQGIQLATDPVRRRILAGVQGGANWSLWEWDGTDWAAMPAPPAVPTVWALGFDPVRSRTVAATPGGLWSWDGATWFSDGGVPWAPNLIPRFVTDPTRRRLVAMLIDQVSAFPAETWEWDGAAWRWIAAAPWAWGPLVFEPLSARVVVVGSPAVWAWDGSAWSQSAIAVAPALSNAVCLDPVRGRLVQFGGSDSAGGLTSDLWEWDGARWAAMAAGSVFPILPTARAVQDAQRQRVVVFGSVGVTWEWDGSTWTRWSVPGPGGRFEQALAWDGRRNRVVLFGGLVPGTQPPRVLDDLWEWDGSAWTQATTSLRPPARADALLVFDAARQQLVLHGGWSAGPSGHVLHDDTWLWDGTSWQQAPTATRPARRLQGGIAYDAARRRVVLSGGSDAYGQLAIDDTWTWDGSVWHNAVPGTWRAAPHLAPQMQDDAARQRVVRLGGPSWAVTEWDGTAWLPRAAPGGPTAPSQDAREAYRSARLLIYDAATATHLLLTENLRRAWRYRPTQPASLLAFGTSCAGGTAPAPGLRARDGVPPWLGSAFVAEVTDLGPGVQGAFVLLGASRASWFGQFALPLSLTGLGMPGCALLVRGDLIATAARSGATATWSLPVCACPELLGSTFFLQGMAIDPGANAGGALFTHGLAGRIGAR